jgi:REP element-mobilizing transposase RayT
MRNPVPHYYHCATKGFDHSILFADTREFIAGMNRIGICQARLQEEKVIVIAFCLMDNHVHIIMYGTREACLKWMALYHRLTMIWQGKHRDGAPVNEEWEYDAWQIYDTEDLKEKIAYVFRNPTVARMSYVPNGYRWSSAPLVFADSSAQTIGGKKVGLLSIYESRKLFETRAILPEDWIVLPDNMIWPGCYTDSKRVEKLFGHPRAFLFFLNQNVEADINQEMYQGSLSLPDADVIQMAKEQSVKLFGTDVVSSLDLTSRIQLCKVVKKKSGTSLKQLARIVQVPLAELKKIFG